MYKMPFSNYDVCFLAEPEVWLKACRKKLTFLSNAINDNFALADLTMSSAAQHLTLSVLKVLIHKPCNINEILSNINTKHNSPERPVDAEICHLTLAWKWSVSNVTPLTLSSIKLRVIAETSVHLIQCRTDYVDWRRLHQNEFYSWANLFCNVICFIMTMTNLVFNVDWSICQIPNPI